MSTFTLTAGATPLLVSMPHTATSIPSELAARMTEAGRALPDTDWHLHRLYEFASELGAGVLRPEYSRYVTDLNRAPDGRALYKGANNTELCPTSTFAEEPIWRAGEEPQEAEIAERRERYWRPYHAALAAELDRLKERYGIALLWDAHSIRSHVPRFFEGRLPDLNLGTGSGTSAAPDLIEALMAVAGDAAPYTAVLDGRFKGGYITRAYGRPADGVHAVQLELAQIAYMDEDPPFTYRPEKAARLQPVLKALLQAMLDWAAAQPDCRP
ncbi:MAG TPA: N-formylglutamate deformylase [Methylomirabilota bacterium]|nr:N-formylglutamate deformylase [Methylomirabilota bacterium]